MADPCDHPQFKVSTTVQRLGVSGHLRLRAIVFCTACGKQFEFMGLPTGYNPTGAGASADRREVFLAIRPATQGLVLNPFPQSVLKQGV
jgi:hypothetical protein